MNRQISIRLKEDEYQHVVQAATREGISVTGYIKKNALTNLNHVTQESHVTLDMVVDKVESLNADAQFKLKDLFLPQEWQNFSKTSRLSVGRTFYQAVFNNQLKEKIIAVEKSSDNTRWYQKL